MEALLYLIVYLLVLAILIYVVQLVVEMLPLPSKIKTIIYLILGVVALIWILGAFTGYGMPLIIHRP